MTTTHARSTTRTAQRFPVAGPAVDLIDSPDPAGVPPTWQTEVDAHLSELEASRQRQLAELPSSNLDTVEARYRATIERTLEEVRAARARVVTGRYGVCTGCSETISEQRLELRPFAAMCAPCAQRD